MVLEFDISRMDTWVLVKNVLPESEVKDLVAPWLARPPLAHDACTAVCCSRARCVGLCQVAYFVAALVSLISLYLKVKILVEQLRKRRTEVELDEEDSATPLKKHTDRLGKTHRTLRLIYASMMIGVAEVCQHARVKGDACAASLIVFILFSPIHPA